jgi:hypothetical protein
MGHSGCLAKCCRKLFKKTISTDRSAMIANGKGAQTHLVRMLSGPFEGYPQMPFRGPYATRRKSKRSRIGSTRVPRIALDAILSKTIARPWMNFV